MLFYFTDVPITVNTIGMCHTEEVKDKNCLKLPFQFKNSTFVREQSTAVIRKSLTPVQCTLPTSCSTFKDSLCILCIYRYIYIYTYIHIYIFNKYSCTQMKPASFS